MTEITPKLKDIQGNFTPLEIPINWDDVQGLNKPENKADVTANNNNWSEVTDDDSHKPDNDATVGAQLGSNLLDESSTTLYDKDVIRLLQYLYGDGSDGDVNINDGGTTVLTSDMYYDDLTISNNSVLDPAGYRVFVKGTLTIESGSSISRVGNAGGNASGMTGGTAGAALAAGYYPASEDGKAGGAGGSGNNNPAGDGTAGDSVSNSVGSNGAAGGAGGAGGVAGGAAGAAGTATATTITPRNHVDATLFVDHSNLGSLAKYNASAGSGSGGGGGGGGVGETKPGGGGGGSGSVGGIVGVFAKIISIVGNITVIGGAGGNGANAGAGTGTGGGGGGGAGADGGVIILVYNSKSGAGSLLYTGGAAGSKGTGDNDGFDGAAGGNGILFEFQN